MKVLLPRARPLSAGTGIGTARPTRGRTTIGRNGAVRRGESGKSAHRTVHYGIEPHGDTERPEAEKFDGEPASDERSGSRVRSVPGRRTKLSV